MSGREVNVQLEVLAVISAAAGADLAGAAICGFRGVLRHWSHYADDLSEDEFRQMDLDPDPAADRSGWFVIGWTEETRGVTIDFSKLTRSASYEWDDEGDLLIYVPSRAPALLRVVVSLDSDG